MSKDGLSKEKSRALLLQFNKGDLDISSFVNSHGYDSLNSKGVKEFVDSAYFAEYLSIINRINPDYFVPHLPHTANNETIAVTKKLSALTKLFLDYYKENSPTQA